MSVATCCGTQATADHVHPLDPLDAAEFTQAIAIIRADPRFGPAIAFETIELNEPPKAAVRAWQPGSLLPREARACVFRPSEPGLWRLTVSLTEGRVTASHHLPTARPIIQLEQFLEVERIVRDSPDFQAACAKRGVTDMTQVCVDPWSAGNFGVPGEEGRYLVHSFSWLRLREGENFYAHPIEGLNAVVDLREGRVIRVDDYGVTPIPMAEHNYEAALTGPKWDGFRPLDVVQPEGPSFTLKGRRIEWHKWSVRVGFNAREAVTLHDIRFDGRPIVYRASMAEMVVPYGTPDKGHFRKNVFDIGEYGLGKLCNALKLGCDCLGTIQYLDGVLNTMTGEIMTLENAICIHEEDDGLAWKHWDFRTDRTEVRRARRLVISCICTVGNYEYALYWYLHVDGAIKFEVKATGIINTAACIPGQPGPYGTEVAPGVMGHIHQHIFCARLDMAVDGDANSVVECNTQADPPGPANPYGNAFREVQTVLETDTGRRADPASHRYWKITNTEKTNHVGTPVAYKLEPSHTVTPFVAPDSPSGKRAGFVQNHAWFTAFDADERYPAGEYMNHSDGTAGVPDFAARGRSLVQADVVLWHVFGLHHQPRPEDFPVQPCIRTGFSLLPSGFFNANPAIDLAPSTNAASRHACCD